MDAPPVSFTASTNLPRQQPHGQYAVHEARPAPGQAAGTLPAREAPSLAIPNFVEQYYQTSTFHHLSSWRMQMQKMVAQKVQPQAMLARSTDAKNTDSPSSGNSNFGSSSSSSNDASCEGSPPSSGISSPLRRSTAATNKRLSNGVSAATIGSPLATAVQHHQTKEENVIPDYGCLSAPSLPSRRFFLHVDMDCFYASVTIRDHPWLRGQPLVVCPSRNSEGTSEVAACSYEAKKYGIKARMYVRDARKLCPELQVFPCEYEKYEQVSKQIYSIFFKYTNYVQAVSADEAFLDVSTYGDGEQVACQIRREIFEQTGCTASAGIAHNLLLARLATKKAKPNGQYHLVPEEVPQFLNGLPVGELPGVGPSTTKKLATLGVTKVSELLAHSKDALQKAFGKAKGSMLWEFARGIDNRPLKMANEQKSVGAQISWGVRFTTHEQVKTFISNLSAEVVKRMSPLSVMASRVTVKIKRKDSDQEPDKVMDVGAFIEVSNSVTLSHPTDDSTVLARSVYTLYQQRGIPPHEVRGMGIFVDKLEPKVNKTTTTKRLESFFDAAKRAPPPSGDKSQQYNHLSTAQQDTQVVIKQEPDTIIIKEEEDEEEQREVPQKENEQEKETGKEACSSFTNDTKPNASTSPHKRKQPEATTTPVFSSNKKQAQRRATPEQPTRRRGGGPIFGSPSKNLKQTSILHALTRNANNGSPSSAPSSAGSTGPVSVGRKDVSPSPK